MDRINNTQATGKQSSQLPHHEFVLIELVGLKKKADGKLWDYDNCEKVVIGYAQRNPLSKFLSYNIVKVSETGETIGTDLVIDSRQDGDFQVKVKGEETVVAADGTSRTFPFTSLARLYVAPSKKDPTRINYRGNAYTGKAWEGKVLRLFRNDGKFVPTGISTGGAIQATGT